jgi:hypothetical protein
MNIKNKIDTNKLIITRADNGKTLVLLTLEEYKHIIQNFIQDNHLIKINKNPTQQYQKIIKQTLKQCNDIQKEHRWRYINMKPITPNLYATVKLHKDNKPIRPIINCKNSRLLISKQLSKTLHNYLQLSYTYNIRNSIHLMTAYKPSNEIKIQDCVPSTW